MQVQVGDIVHYFTQESRQHSNGQGNGPYPAIVTQTFSGRDELNLKVMPPFRPPFDEGSVPMLTNGENKPFRYWLPRE